MFRETGRHDEGVEVQQKNPRMSRFVGVGPRRTISTRVEDFREKEKSLPKQTLYRYFFGRSRSSKLEPSSAPFYHSLGILWQNSLSAHSLQLSQLIQYLLKVSSAFTSSIGTQSPPFLFLYIYYSIKFFKSQFSYNIFLSHRRNAQPSQSAPFVVIKKLPCYILTHGNS